jgi:hypothetical protein
MAKKRSVRDAGSASSAPAGFVFRGTVERARASTIPGLPADAGTVVVRVNEVLEAPPALAKLAGREVTVVDAGKAARAGQEAIFHTNGVRFGEGIAVRAVRVEPLAPAAPARGPAAARAAAAPLAAAAGTGAPDPAQAHHERQLKRQLDAADVVVAGTVTDVRMAPETLALAGAPAAAIAAPAGGRRGARGAARAAGAAPGPPPWRRISEHDPLWQEAVVHVESVEKGATNQKQVVVRFPGSNDVAWRNHPKFRPGQQGVFLLNRSGGAATSVPAAAAGSRRGVAGARRGGGGGSRAALTAAPVATSATPSMQAAENPQPISAIETVRRLLGSEASSSTATASSAKRASSRRASGRRGRSKGK